MSPISLVSDADESIREDVFSVGDSTYRLELLNPRPEYLEIGGVNDGRWLVDAKLYQNSVLLFDSKQHGVPAHKSIDGDDTVAAVMGFMCLRPGDTDAEYFAGYTDAQMAFAQGDAEYLLLEVLEQLEAEV